MNKVTLNTETFQTYCKITNTNYWWKYLQKKIRTNKTLAI